MTATEQKVNVIYIVYACVINDGILGCGLVGGVYVAGLYQKCLLRPRDANVNQTQFYPLCVKVMYESLVNAIQKHLTI